jgi:hypothetical protein
MATLPVKREPTRGENVTSRRAVLLDVALLLAAAIAVVALPLGFAIWGG